MVDEWADERRTKRDVKYYNLLVRSDIEKSLVDLERDLKGHREALLSNLSALEVIKNYYSQKITRKVYKLNASINVDHLFSDFQFYPINGAFLCLMNQRSEILKEIDSELVELYLGDFKRLEQLGKEYSQSKNINKLWEEFLGSIIYIDPSGKDDNTYKRLDSYAYGVENAIVRHKSNFKELNDMELRKVYSKLEMTIEIRMITIYYYESVRAKALAVLEKVST